MFADYVTCKCVCLYNINHSEQLFFTQSPFQKDIPTLTWKTKGDAENPPSLKANRASSAVGMLAGEFYEPPAAR